MGGTVSGREAGKLSEKVASEQRLEGEEAALQMFPHSFFTAGGDIMIPVSQMRKVSLQEVAWVTHGHRENSGGIGGECKAGPRPSLPLGKTTGSNSARAPQLPRPQQTSLIDQIHLLEPDF